MKTKREKRNRSGASFLSLLQRTKRNGKSQTSTSSSGLFFKDKNQRDSRLRRRFVRSDTERRVKEKEARGGGKLVRGGR